MALQFNRTDAATGHQYTVYARIDAGTFSLSDGVGQVTLNLYDSVGAAHAGLQPVLPADKIVLTDAESATLRTQGLALLYAILKSRATYSAAQDV